MAITSMNVGVLINGDLGTATNPTDLGRSLGLKATKNLSGGVTTGTPISQPYKFIPGGGRGNSSDVIIDGGQQLVPFFDGTNFDDLDFPLPKGFDSLTFSNIDLATFSSWNSILQAHFVRREALKTGAANEFGIFAMAGVNVTLTDSRTKVLILENLQKTDLAKLTVPEQTRLTASSVFAPIAAKLGVEFGAAKTNFLTGIDDVLRKLGYNVVVGNHVYQSIGVNPPNAPSRDNLDGTSLTGLSNSDRGVFGDELQVLARSVAAIPLVDSKELSTKLKEIIDRLKMAAQFSAFDPVSMSAKFPPDARYDFVSTDGNATIVSGASVLMTQERRIRDIQVSEANFIATLSSANQIDAPQLATRFMLDRQLETEAKVIIKTEIIKQLNALLRDYSAMQGMVNETLELFDSNDKEKTLKGIDHWAELTTGQQYLASMFEEFMSTGTHPLEAIFKIGKPSLSFSQNDAPGRNNDDDHMNEFTKEAWNAFNASLSDAVSQLNQQSQLLMNDTNSLTKQKDRFFDFTNTLLSKQTDLLLQVARTIA